MAVSRRGRLRGGIEVQVVVRVVRVVRVLRAFRQLVVPAVAVPMPKLPLGTNRLREETARFCHQTNCEQLGSGRRLSTRRHLIRVPSIRVRNLRSVMRVPCITRGREWLRCTRRRAGRVLIRTIRRGLRDIVATVWVVEK